MNLNDVAAYAATSIQRIREAVDRLSPGEALSIQLDFHPELLCRVMDDKRLQYRLEEHADGGWCVDFRQPHTRRM